MRMKCLRILPEICASTWCWLSSNSTRNIALGKISSTFAMTSIASSFAISSQRSFDAADKLRIIARGFYVCQAALALSVSGGRTGLPDTGAGRQGQHFRALFRDRYRVLDVGAGLAV